MIQCRGCHRELVIDGGDTVDVDDRSPFCTAPVIRADAEQYRRVGVPVPVDILDCEMMPRMHQPSFYSDGE